jgi:decaprenylphospho-beta-D-erythro-pentofuranosid-2-ulose 2-reductase
VKTVIIGATKGIGRSIARQLAERGDSLFLLGRDLEDLQRSAADLKARASDANNEPVAGSACCDLADFSGFEQALDAADTALGGIDTVIVTAGMFGTQDALQADVELAAAVLNTNFTGTVVLCEHARKRLLEGGGGTLCVLSSVAGDRARKPVILYGASKAGLSYYLEGLDHKYRSQGLITVCVKPGFVKTGMTAGLKPPPFAGEPDAVAARIIKAIDKGSPVVYAPPMWALVMLVIRNLPRFVMRKIGF